jgi:hypothetical protein
MKCYIVISQYGDWDGTWTKIEKVFIDKHKASQYCDDLSIILDNKKLFADMCSECLDPLKNHNDCENQYKKLKKDGDNNDYCSGWVDSLDFVEFKDVVVEEYEIDLQ